MQLLLTMFHYYFFVVLHVHVLMNLWTRVFAQIDIGITEHIEVIETVCVCRNVSYAQQFFLFILKFITRKLDYRFHLGEIIKMNGNISAHAPKSCLNLFIWFQV